MRHFTACCIAWPSRPIVSDVYYHATLRENVTYSYYQSCSDCWIMRLSKFLHACLPSGITPQIHNGARGGVCRALHYLYSSWCCLQLHCPCVEKTPAGNVTTACVCRKVSSATTSSTVLTAARLTYCAVSVASL